MPTVPWHVRGLAVLAAPGLLLAEGAWAAHVGAGALLLAYVAFWLAAPRPWSAALAMLTIPAALVASLGVEQPSPVIGLLWAYVAIGVCFAAPDRLSGATVIAVAVLAIIASFPVLGGLGAADVGALLVQGLPHATLAVGLPVVTAGLAASTARRLLDANDGLRRARQQLAVAAVQEERTRFARDLHDLLGHSLTVLVAKVRLARRLPGPEADRELADAERLALGALDDVRQAVAGYRAPTLDSQIAGARVALAAAGIEFEVSGSANPVAAGAEGALAISVREAVTNVVRHSGASRCWLTIGRDGGSAWVDVRDDGRAVANGPASGLAGLRDRLAGIGGAVDWGTVPDGGFRVHACVPAEGGAEEPAPA